jgi:multiple sugar transport system ATP-binding protein
MSQLEPHLRAKLRARIKDYLIQNKMTSVFVTHDQTEAMALADRIAVMSEGVLQQFGTPVDLKERPSNLFVAGFIGEPPMNLLRGEVVKNGERKVQVLDEQNRPAFSIPLPASASQFLPGKKVHVGLRPHKLTVGAAVRSAVAKVNGQVISNQWLGDQTYVGIEVGGVTVLVVSDQHTRAEVDSQIVLGLEPEALHFFDSDTGVAMLHGTDLTH